MGNTWSYSIVFQNTTQFTSELFDQMLDLANDYSYQLRYPTLIAASSEDQEFTDKESLSTYICSKNVSIFPVWNGELAIQLGFYPSDHSIDLYVDYNLRQGRDEQINSDLEKVFLAFCQKFQVCYGYCSDEWSLEDIFPGTKLNEIWDKFKSSISKREPPLLLFWVNYFSNDYFASIGEWRFEELQPAKLVRTEHGVFMYLAASIWNIQHAILGEDGKYHLIGPDSYSA